MLYTIYKITNTVNGKFYIGCHITTDLYDSYMGSGLLLGKAIAKYGLDKFVKDTLHVFDNPAEMYAKETEIVNETFIADPNTYNLRLGGLGGWGYIHQSIASGDGEMREKYLSGCSRGGIIGGPKSKGRIHPPRTEENQKLLRDNHWTKNPEIAANVSKSISLANTGKKNGFFGKHHNAESLAKISGPRPNSLGEKNSQFGTCWVTNGIENKKIKKKELDNFVSLGYNKGRKIK